MTLTLGTFIRQIIRSVESPRLSLTAYGDEGVLLGRVSRVLGTLAYLHGGQGEAVEAYFDDYQSSLAMPIEKIPEPVIRNLVSFLEGMLAAYEPLRVVQEDCERRDLLTLIHDRLSMDGAIHGVYQVDLLAMVISVINCRELFEVVRGDENWAVLHRCDLLAPLGPYIVEHEAGVCPCANTRSCAVVR